MTAGLPVSLFVVVDINLSALQAQAPAVNTALFLGTSTVIDTVEREREYFTLGEVAADFGTTAPEYLAAVLWFGQSPQPTNLFIGRWVDAASAGQLIGGGITAANLLISAWTSITAGAFFITVDRVPYALNGLNFAAVTNLNGVASVIQTALRAATSGMQTVVYNNIYNNFVITDSTTGTSSVIGFVAPSTAVGNAAFSGQPTANDTLTIQGTAITFVASGATGNQVNIGGSLAVTLGSLLTFLNASVDTQLVKMTYSVVASTLYMVSVLTGTTGNAYTLAKSSTAITLSASTLAGGAAGDISAMLAMTNTAGNGAYQAPGLAAESAVTAVALFDNMFSTQWYGLVIVAGAVDSDHQAVAAYIEGVAPAHYYGVTTQEAGTLVASSTSDLAYVLAQLAYNHTAIQYSSTSLYAICSYLARILTTEWLGQDTTITLWGKQEPGVVAETLTVTQQAAAKAKNCNLFVAVNNGTNIIIYGTSCSGQFTDTVIGADWLAGEVQTMVYDALEGTPTKIPQTDAGMGVLIAAAAAACQLAVNNGYLAPGIWNSAGFGSLVQGQNLPAGFYVYAPPIATQSEAVRQTRAAPVMQIAAKNAGALQSSDIVLNVNQ